MRLTIGFGHFLFAIVGTQENPLSGGVARSAEVGHSIPFNPPQGLTALSLPRGELATISFLTLPSDSLRRYTTKRPGFRIPRGSYCCRICCIKALSLKSYPQTSIPAFKDAGADSTMTVPREGFNSARKF